MDIIQDKFVEHIRAVNAKLEAPKPETFKYKSSQEAIKRIDTVSEQLRDLRSYLRREIGDFERTDSDKLLQNTPCFGGAGRGHPGDGLQPLRLQAGGGVQKQEGWFQVR